MRFGSTCTLMIWVAKCAVVSAAGQAIVTVCMVTATKACIVMHYQLPLLICCCQQLKVPTDKPFHPSPPPPPAPSPSSPTPPGPHLSKSSFFSLHRTTQLSCTISLSRNISAHTGMSKVLLAMQGLLHGCSKALKQIREPAQPCLPSACSLSTSQQVQAELDSKVLTCPAIKAEPGGCSAACQSSSGRPEGSRLVYLLPKANPAGSQMTSLSAMAKPEGSLTSCLSAKGEPSGIAPGHVVLASGVHQQDVLVTQEPFPQPQGSLTPSQLTQASAYATHDIVSGNNSSQVEAERGSGIGQVGVRLGLCQCQAEQPHEPMETVKRRCMPNWGKANEARTGPVSSTHCAGCHSDETRMAPLPAMPAALEAGTSRCAVARSQL